MSLDELERLAKKAQSTDWAPLQYHYMQALSPERFLALIACVRAAYNMRIASTEHHESGEFADCDGCKAVFEFDAARAALNKLL